MQPGQVCRPCLWDQGSLTFTAPAPLTHASSLPRLKCAVSLGVEDPACLAKPALMTLHHRLQAGDQARGGIFER